MLNKTNVKLISVINRQNHINPVCCLLRKKEIDQALSCCREMFSLSTAAHLSGSLADHSEPTVRLRQFACRLIDNGFRYFLLCLVKTIRLCFFSQCLLRFRQPQDLSCLIFPICLIAQCCVPGPRVLLPHICVCSVSALFVTTIRPSQSKPFILNVSKKIQRGRLQ